MVEPYVDSSALADFPAFSALFPPLSALIGAPLQWSVVLDANMAIGDLLHKVRNPQLKQTSIEEGVRAGALGLYAPQWLDEEMLSSTIPQVSRDKNIPKTRLLELWQSYKELITWDDEFVADHARWDAAFDQKDVPYVELAERIEAAGILSRDKDIRKLGGTPLDLNFVLSVKRYARAKSYQVTIYGQGMFVGQISLGGLGAFGRGVADVFSRLPDWAKWVVVIGVVVALMHPKVRAQIFGLLSSLTGLGAEALNVIGGLTALAAEKGRAAEIELLELQDFPGEPMI